MSLIKLAGAASAKIEVSDKELSVAFDLNALARLEEAGISLDKLETLDSMPKVKLAGLLLWASLASSGDERTQKEVSSLLGLGDIRPVITLLFSLLGASLPPQEAPRQ